MAEKIDMWQKENFLEDETADDDARSKGDGRRRGDDAESAIGS